MATEAQGQGPPELIVKLAFQFLCWKEVRTEDYNILTSAGLVCKRWKELLEADDVGKPLCLNLLNSYEALVAIRNRNSKATAEEHGIAHVEEIYLPFDRHEFFAKLMAKGPIEGRSYKDLFLLSERMGKLLDDHKYDGPDARGWRGRDTRTLRDASMHDYRWLVKPTLDKLREVFDDQNHYMYSRRHREVEEMKIRLLAHARGDGRAVLRRKIPLDTEEEKLAEYGGRLVLMLAASNELDKNMFIPSSPLSATLGEIIDMFESSTEGGISVQMSFQLKKTSSGLKREYTFLPKRDKILGVRIDELDWPMSPVDCLSLLIRKPWPIKDYVGDYVEYDTFNMSKEEKEELWGVVITKFWRGLAETVRQLFVTVYNEKVAGHTVDVEQIPEELAMTEVPLDHLKLMFELPYHFFREKIAESIWIDLDPKLREQIYDMYHQQARMLCEAIKDEYHSVYSDTSAPERNAKFLLDIFLEVPRNNKQPELPTLTTEYCDNLLDRMEETMSRWNELIEEVKSDEGVLWNPQTIIELNSFESMFGHCYRSSYMVQSQLRDGKVVNLPTLEFCVPRLVAEFLYQKLSATQRIPDYSQFGRDARQFFDEYIRYRKGQQPTSHSRTVERNTRGETLVREFRPLSTFIHTREHAMTALIPLLPHLSKEDSKRLVYALFIERKIVEPECRRWGWKCPPFSSSYDTFGVLNSDHIPCAVDEDSSDCSRFFEWLQCEHYAAYDEDVLGRIFGLPLPKNIALSMTEFMVENLYQGHIEDVDKHKIDNAFGVGRFLERFTYESPESAHIVWEGLRGAIQNAISVVEDFDPHEVTIIERDIWIAVIESFVAMCIHTRAVRLISVLRRLYDGTQFALLPGTFVTFKNLVKRIKQTHPIVNDTLTYHIDCSGIQFKL